MQAITMRKCVLSIILVVGIISAGCSSSGNFHSINFAGDLSIDDGTFSMMGELRVGMGYASHQTWENVTIVLYDNHTKEIGRFAIGKLSTDPNTSRTSAKVNISADTVPKYVLIRSPDFWSEGIDMEVQAFVLRPEIREYELYERTGPNEITP